MPELGDGVTVVALPDSPPATVTLPAPPSAVTVLPVPGPPGPPGGGPGTGAGALIHQQVTPSASWLVPHTLGRLPAVDLYVGGFLVDADVEATTTAVTVTFPTPTVGFAVLV